MESTLYMWSGYLMSWKKHYFILDDNNLLYCADKGSEIQGRISLQLINIHVPVDNLACFNIHTGMDVIYLKALSIEDKVRWVKKINRIIKNREKSGLGQLKEEIGYYASRKEQMLDRFEEYIKELWIAHAKLEGAIENLSLKHNFNSGSISMVGNVMDDVRRTASSFKFKATEISKFLQEISKYLEDQSTKLKSKKYMSEDYVVGDDSEDADDTCFLSFTQDDRTRAENRNLRVTKAKNPVKRKVNRGAFFDSQPYENDQQDFNGNFRPRFSYTDNRADSELMSEYEVTPIKSLYVSENLIKKKLFQGNKVFVKIFETLVNRKQRDSLPQKFTPETKFPVLSALSNALGSNLNKITFPVTLNEPISMLQKGCEQMYYSELLRKADHSKDPLERMAYVCAFIVSGYSLSDRRIRKPFSPLLGETFVYDDKQRDFFYFAEQISTNPQISASFCRSEQFELIGNLSSELSFSGKSLKLIPTGNHSQIFLNEFDDKYTFNRCTIAMNNLFFGNTYIDVLGQINVECSRLRTKAVITFHQKSWNQQQFSISGKIYGDPLPEGSNRNVSPHSKQYKISGFWNKEFSTKDTLTSKQKTIWRKSHIEIPDQYNFNHYTLQLNHLPLPLVKEVPPTDSRFRPDQRILEYRDIELATEEKNRLEEAERGRKDFNEKQKKPHRTVWFKSAKDKDQESYIFLNEKYENERFRDDKWDESLDIFN